MSHELCALAGALDLTYRALGRPHSALSARGEARNGTFCWDGRERLTVQGEPHLVVHCWNAGALAAVLLRIAAPEAPLSDQTITACAAELVAPRFGAAFTLDPHQVRDWLAGWRQRQPREPEE